MAARYDIFGVWGEENSPGIHWTILDCCHLLEIYDNDDEQKSSSLETNWPRVGLMKIIC